MSQRNSEKGKNLHTYADSFYFSSLLLYTQTFQSLLKILIKSASRSLHIVKFVWNIPQKLAAQIEIALSKIQLLQLTDST